MVWMLLVLNLVTNNNIIIPILTMNPPVSNINKGKDVHNNINENENITKNNENKEKIESKKELINFYNNSKNKNCKSQEIKGRFNASMINK